MKRGKDDEKTMGPMFPRLHVNDTEKGGPRAPPRNKMALYEQLSVPSQRFNNNNNNNHGALPLNPTKATNVNPAASSSQGSGYEQNLHIPLHVPPSTPSLPAEMLHSRQPDRRNSNATSAQIEQRKKVGDEDDFRVPVFLHSGMGQCLGKTQSGIDRENSTTFSQNYLGRSSKLQNAGNKDHNNNSSRGSNLRQDVSNQSEENLEVCVSSRDHSVKSFTSLPTKEQVVRPDDASPNQQNSDDLVASSLCENDVRLQQEAFVLLQKNDSGHGEGVPELRREIEKGYIPQRISGSQSREDLNSPNEPEIDSEHRGDKNCRSVQFGNGNKSDDVSETSMVDSASALDISPDDVVGIIGQKHFWKARRAIVNQQRLFAVQVFELHRLIKVQRLIAASPHLLLEESTYLGKSSVKVSSAKKLSSEYVVTPSVHVAKRKVDLEKSNHNMEYSAENAVGKFLSVKNGSELSTENPTPVPLASDNKMAPWCFHHSHGHQWLVPVMSPSEGLVYKPYTAPGFMGSVCGGCGPFGLTPLTGNFMTPTDGVPASHHLHQGTMPISNVPPIGHGYFPPYGMPIMNPAMSGSAVEQMNYYSGTGSHGPTGQLSGGGASFNVQHPSSCNVPIQKSGSIPRVTKLQESKDAELQGSTASSPSERVQGVGNAQAAETRDGAPQPQETNQPRRVIKVVPHNRRSATESAARIFQSIQEERKQFDFI